MSLIILTLCIGLHESYPSVLVRQRSHQPLRLLERFHTLFPAVYGLNDVISLEVRKPGALRPVRLLAREAASRFEQIDKFVDVA